MKNIYMYFKNFEGFQINHVIEFIINMKMQTI